MEPVQTLDAVADLLLPRAGLGPELGFLAEHPALGALSAAGFDEADAAGRLELFVRLNRSEEHGLQLRALRGAVFGSFYTRPEESAALGYPAPQRPPSPELAPKTIPVEAVSGPTAELHADVCVVGSGAGGAVVAAELQRRGRSVVVLERGGYRNEADFHQLEARSGAELMLKGGPFFAEGGTIGILAGGTLGGGTVINSMVSLRPPDSLRGAWAREGLTGLDDSSFDDHLDAVWSRLSVNTEATRPNAVNELLRRTLDALGEPWRLLPRNVSLDDDPRYCGHCNSGCQRGSKRSTLTTYLQDAADAGARFVVDCRADRILVEHGRATGVQATVCHPDGSVTVLRIHAPTVVVAGGGIESPALLLRSRLGGRETGRNLTLHPAFFVSGVHDEALDGWAGQFQAISTDDDAPFLVECVGVSPAVWATSMPFASRDDHRRRMLELGNVASWHALVHDRGAGSVELDPTGEARVRWQLDDPADREHATAAQLRLARLHHAAGAREIYTFHQDELAWRRGEDFDRFLGRLAAAPNGHISFSAHQMGTCRLGADRATSVADGRGQLHDTKGVWIADASGFPSASGVNPMITIMALARRTAHAILDQ